MECNKEEAIRAKGIAENKMKNNDFAGARKIALKAQQLYNDLDNISQMITVCDVHCSAEKRFFGNEMDWYGILQIEQTADEVTIKKQYRKFALQLHPDKNKFPGAETAFKLIGEAQRVLLDQGKRSVHDMKRTSMGRTAAPYHPSKKPSSYSNEGTQKNSRNNFTSFNFQQQRPQQPAQPEIVNGSQTFWTMCPFCTVRYQYFTTVINKSIYCQHCKKPFVAYESGERGVPVKTNLRQQAFHPQKDVPGHGACKIEQVFKGNFAANSSKKSFDQKTSPTSDEVAKAKVNGKGGRKQIVESSESFDTKSSSDSEVNLAMDEKNVLHGKQNCGGDRDKSQRRSSRHKQKFSYNENLCDDDEFESHPKRAKGSGSSCATEEESGEALKEEMFKMDKQSGSATDVKEEQKVNACFEESLSNGRKETANRNEKAEEDACEKSPGAHTDDLKKKCEVIDDSMSESSSESAKDPEVLAYPDPEFYDFDKERKEECFMAGQIWAAYDTFDAMPRFYARIRKVFSSAFKLQITWLEPDPDDDNEIEWLNRGLPVSCGKFKYGSTETTEDQLMFSHLVSWEKGSQRYTFKVLPKKGEIWGLFKNWDFKWKLESEANRKYEYEFVEILSDYVEGVGTCVAYLAKVKGFACVFCRKSKEGKGSLQIPSGELFRFSHRVPSFTLTGEERDGVLKGSFELDPASLPPNLDEIAVPEILKAEASGSSSRSLGSSDPKKPLMGSEGCPSSIHHARVKDTIIEPEDDRLHDDVKNHSPSPALNAEDIDIPDPEFYNFDADKSEDKLLVGQIWSLYSDEDGLPKYYGQIVKIQPSPAFKLHLRWLVNCSLPKNTIHWRDEDMPICCGNFRIKMGRPQEYTSTSSFSHLVRAEPAAKKNEYSIFPRKGEVWALYRNWNVEINCSDLENCEYDVVEIKEANDLEIKVLFLECLDGFNSVFRPQSNGASPLTMDIPLSQLLRFSHQIPVFKLTEERGGSLKGFWELDLAALPVRYCPSS